MTQIIHCADLHLSAAEKEYGLTVLEEILELAREAQALILAGDVFDSYQDVESLRPEFRRRIADLPQTCRIILIAGNHERRGGGESLSHLDLGCPVCETQPFQLIDLGEVEVLAVPYRSEYSSYLSWAVPPRRKVPRLVVAHGTVVGVTFAGVGGEEEQAAIDVNVLARLGADYAAMGHIHAGRTETVEDVVVAYPGSARVWRRGESGPRNIISLEVEGGLHHRWVPLKRAGQYRFYSIPLDLEGQLPALDRLPERWAPADWVEVKLTGLVEDEHSAADRERELRDRYAPLVRRFDVIRDDILVLEGIATQPIARKFLELWINHRPPTGGREREIWLQAREIGLERIKANMENRG